MESPTDFLVSFVSADPSWKPSIRQNTEDVILTNRFCSMQSHTRLRYHIIEILTISSVQRLFAEIWLIRS